MPYVNYETKLIGLERGDWQRLCELYRTRTPTAVIRKLVRDHIRDLEAVLAEASRATAAQ